MSQSAQNAGVAILFVIMIVAGAGQMVLNIMTLCGK
jgi:hypothetical protein